MPRGSEQEVQKLGCLNMVFRHEVTKHQFVFNAVSVITQLAIENGEPLLAVPEYRDNLCLIQFCVPVKPFYQIKHCSVGNIGLVSLKGGSKATAMMYTNR